MIQYDADGTHSPLWLIAMTDGNYVVARIVAWYETHRILSEKWLAGSFGAGLLLYLYTKDGE